MRSMSRSKKVAAAFAVAAALTLAPAAAAMATTVPAGGGLWSYGVAWPNVYSNYHHPTRYHSATACSSSYSCVQAAAAGGSWANASKYQSLADNSAYWNVY